MIDNELLKELTKQMETLNEHNRVLEYAINNELKRTKKQLEIAKERLEQIAHESFQGDQQSINMGFQIIAAAALTDIEQITAEQKDN